MGVRELPSTVVLKVEDVEHIILPGYTHKRMQPVIGETVAQFLRRLSWEFMLPTVCSFNGSPLMRKDWETTTISARDKVMFLSKPFGGGGGGGNKWKSVIGLLGVIALAAIAPWVATSVLGFASGSFGFYATVAAITIGGGLLLQSFISPKTADTTSSSDIPQLYSLTASGNTANPLQPIPVQYGRLKSEPPYASIPWSEFSGDDQYLNITLCQGLGYYDREQILIDDTVLWDKSTGLNPAFTDVDFQFCDPGQPLTLFPSNVVAASEVDGQEVTQTPLGGFIANAAGTTADALSYDFVLPGGLFALSDDDNNLHNASVTLVMEARTVDDAGTPLSGWITLQSQQITLNTRSPKRLSYKIAVSPGRWECRVSRTTAPSTDTKVSDSVQWAQLRAFLEGSNTFPDASIIGIRIKATSQLSQNSAKKIGIIQTRILPVWNGTAFVNQPTQNPFWAFYDAATNSVYGAVLQSSRIDFQEVYAQAIAADQRGDTFNYLFDSGVTFQEAFDTILASARSKTAWIGDILSVTRDEWKPIPQMLLTDQQTIRGSVSVDYIINDDTYSDCVVCQFLNENTWGPAQLQYPPNSQTFVGLNPATITLPGVTKPTQIMNELGFLYRQSQLRRINVTLDTEHDGRLLRFGSAVKVQSNLPTKWGQSGEVLSYNSATKVLTVDKGLKWTANTTHYIELRDKGGHYFGPVAVGRFGADNLLQLDTADLADVESDLSMTIDDALDRMDGAEPPSFAFGIEGEFARHCIVLSGKPQDDKVTLNLTVDSEAVHDDGADPVPVLPTAPVLVDPRVPVVANLSAIFRQGVAEPIIDATWWPAAGAIYYRAAVSYDNGLSWIALPDTSEPQLSAVVSRAALRLRVSAVSTLQGPWSSVDVAAPDITIGPDTVAPSSLKQGLSDYVMNQLKNGLEDQKKVLQQIASVAADHDASRSVEDMAIRQSLMAVSARGQASVDFLTTTLADLNESFAQYQVVVDAQFDDLESQVTTNATAISDQQSAFASYQIEVTASLGQLQSSIDLNASAIADVSGNLAAAVTLSLNVNGYVSGWQSTNNGTSSTFTVIGSTFNVAEPGVAGGAPINAFSVQIVNGTAKMALRGDMYADGIITANKLNVTSLSAISANIGTITAGYMQSPDGKMIIDLNNGYISVSD